MEIVDVSHGENIITQGRLCHLVFIPFIQSPIGQEGDYFYVVESGKFTVIVDGKPVSQIGEGSSFGELALLYNAPRQATVRADSAAVVFSLDRESYRFMIAQSASDKTKEIKMALNACPLLSELTDDQLEKISEAVELFPYNAGDIIIKKGTEGKVFYMIKEGTVLVDVGEQFSQATLGPGEYFGERALITGEPRAATITAQTKVLLMALDRYSTTFSHEDDTTVVISICLGMLSICFSAPSRRS